MVRLMGKHNLSKAAFALSLAGTAIVAPTVGAETVDTYKLSLDARYDSGVQNKDGGTTEIVTYNKHNHAFYIVNGETKKVEAISLNYGNKKEPALQPFLSIDVAKLIQTVDADFQYGGLTSIVAHPTENVIAASVQAEGFNDAGYAVFLTGEGELLSIVEVAVQPDNITFTPDGTKALTANEGEPREGYGKDVVDPQGSISVIDVSNGFTQLKSTNVTFEAYDNAQKREELVKKQVILKKDAAPSVDLEPEYISVSENSKFAYVSIQENNAIATLDLTSHEVTSIDGLGVKDFSIEGNEIDVRKDGQAKLQNEDILGLYMPDGMATYSVDGKNYVVTANEGDGREWGEEDSEQFHLNEKDIELDGHEIVAFDTAGYDALENDRTYMFGARSFSIFEADTMKPVYDSGSDFERITAERFPEYFNSSNDEIGLDNRSAKKGPEPEDVKVGKIGDEVFAFIGLERIGGVMMYNITDPANAQFVDYLNLRDFSEDVAGDVSPEGMAFVPGKKPQLIVGHEVSGTVTVLNISAKKEATRPPMKDIGHHAAKEAILKVIEAKLFKGVNASAFAPDQSLTRGQAVTVLHRLAGEPASSNKDMAFQDVKPTDYYAQPLSWALSSNVMALSDNKVFQPYKAMTQEEFLVATYNYLLTTGHSFEKAEEMTGLDGLTASEETKEAIHALQSAGIVDEEGVLALQEPITRAEAAIILAKIL